MRRTLLPALTLTAACLALAGPGRAEMKQITTIRLHSQIRINAPTPAIWQYATRGRNFSQWIPMWDRPRNAQINLVQVGNWLQFLDDWNNRGRAVVTYLARNKEVRLAQDPEDGSFMCQVKLTFEQDGTGTIVHFYEQYTDESTPTDQNATAAKVQASMDRALQSLKTEVEKRRAGAARRS